MAKFDSDAWLQKSMQEADSLQNIVQPENLDLQNQQVDKFNTDAWLKNSQSGLKSKRQEQFLEQGFVVVDPNTNYRDNGRIMWNKDKDELIFVSDTYQTSDRDEIERIRSQGDIANPQEMSRMSEQLKGREGEAFALTAAESLPYIGGVIPSVYDAVTGRGFKAPEMQQAFESLGFDQSSNKPISSELISQFETENPMASFGAKGLGLLAPTGAALGLSKFAPNKVPSYLSGRTQREMQGGPILSTTKNVAYQTGSGAAEAGGEASIYAFGKALSEGQPLDQARKEALGAGVVGASFGGPLSGGLSLVGEAFNKFINRSSQTSIADQISKQFGYSPETSSLIEASIADGLDIPQTIERLKRAGEGGVLADADPAVAFLLDAASSATARTRARATETLQERADQASKKIDPLFDRTFGEGISPQFEPIEQIMKRTRTQRRNAYGKAYAQKIDYESDAGKEIISILEDLQKVDPNFVSSVQGRMDFLGAFDADNIKAPMFQDVAIVSKDGQIKYDRAPSVKALDLIKRKINDMAYTPNVDASERGALVELSRRLRSALGNAASDYNAATKIGGDAIANRNAYEIGSQLNRRPSYEVYGAATESKESRQSLQEGVRSYLNKIINSAKRPVTGTDSSEIAETLKTLRETSSGDFRQKIKMIMPKKEADKFFKELDEIKVRFETKGIVGTGSATAMRQQNIRYIDDITNPTLRDAASATLTDGFSAGIGKLKAALNTGDAKTRELIADEMINFLTSVKVGRRTPEKALDMLKKMKEGRRDAKDIAFVTSTYLRNLVALPFARSYARETDIRK
jgi:hypothetical protein